MGPVVLKIQTPNPPFLVVLLFKEVSGLLFCDGFWHLFSHLDFIVLLGGDACSVPRLLREHMLMVITSFQIKRDLEVSGCLSLLDTFPPDVVSAL